MPLTGLAVMLALLAVHRKTAAAAHQSSSARICSSSSSSSSESAVSIARPAVTRFNPLPFDVRRCTAPMVGQSDLAFRMLTRAHGATAAYTPMLYADRFIRDAAYRAEVVDFGSQAIGATVAAQDRPLIVQFAANDASILLQAARMVESSCDAVDINLGCPQERAKEGHYGSFLLDRRDWPRVIGMVRTLHEHLSVPVMCKIRLLKTEAETLEFCLLLQEAGCACIAIHARQRGSNRRRRVGPADLALLTRLRPHLSIPLIANGNILVAEDVDRNLAMTGCEGVMSADGILANPRIFAPADQQTGCVEMAEEYLDFCSRFPPPPLHWVADHVHNIARSAIVSNRWPELRARLKAVGREVSLHASDDSGGGGVRATTDADAWSEGIRAIRAVLAELASRLEQVRATGLSGRVQLQMQRAAKRRAAREDAYESVSFDDVALLDGSADAS